jgi:hypothetical protein
MHADNMRLLAASIIWDAREKKKDSALDNWLCVQLWV